MPDTLINLIRYTFHLYRCSMACPRHSQSYGWYTSREIPFCAPSQNGTFPPFHIWNTSSFHHHGPSDPDGASSFRPQWNTSPSTCTSTLPLLSLRDARYHPPIEDGFATSSDKRKQVGQGTANAQGWGVICEAGWSLQTPIAMFWLGPWTPRLRGVTFSQVSRSRSRICYITH